MTDRRSDSDRFRGSSPGLDLLATCPSYFLPTTQVDFPNRRNPVYTRCIGWYAFGLRPTLLLLILHYNSAGFPD